MSDTREINILPVYTDLVKDQSDIIFTWGGRDSGKSHFLGQKAIIKMLDKDNYFRLILVKKTYESIRDSQFQVIKDIVDELGLSDLFKFTRSPMEITTTIAGNENKAIARGCDKPEKLKSISNPSHVWYEEGNQLTQEDYETITTTLRTNRTKIQEWFSFNPESSTGLYEDFWLYKTFFAEYEEQNIRNFVGKKTVEVDGFKKTITYISRHTTYQDNKYCSDDRVARHEILKDTNPYRYKVFTMGMWGNEDNTNPFFYSFERSKHYLPDQYKINRSYSLDISFDFNTNPCTCVVGQYEVHTNTWHIIASHYASPDSKSSLENLCQLIERTYLHYVNRHQIRVTGDSTGRAGDTDRAVNLNRYTSICRYLKLSQQQVKVEKSNIKHTLSRDLINDVLHQLPKGSLTFYAGTEMLIENIQASYPDHKGTLNDAKKRLGLHDVDCFRYLIKYWFAHGLKGTTFKKYQNQLKATIARSKSKARRNALTAKK